MWPYMWRFPCQKLCVSTEVYGSGRPQPYNITVEIKERALRCRPRKRWTNAYGSGKCASGKDERTALYYITHSVHGYITHICLWVQTLNTWLHTSEHPTTAKGAMFILILVSPAFQAIPNSEAYSAYRAPTQHQPPLLKSLQKKLPAFWSLVCVWV